jgi:hypothetical protein
MKKIALTKTKFALVDDDNFEKLNQWNWNFSRGYATRHIYIGTKRTTVRMHRTILNIPSGMYPDHIDGNKLNNQKSNLRICTHSQNMMNRKIQANSTGYKGVSYCNTCYKGKKYQYIQAHIRINKKLIYLGTFPDLISAAKAYDAKAKELFGEFARTNESLGLYKP